RALCGPERAVRRLDRELASWDIRSRLAHWYGLIGRPIPVRDSLWLLLRRLQHGGVREIRGDIVVDNSAFAPADGAPEDFDGEALRRWLAEVRRGARAQPVELRLTRDGQGWRGSVVLALGGGG
ncbi:MAG TPA: hypothetical protein PKA84_08115, partial [Rubrivivax sp.]|nr:hypothetical protein [Rubrivivax sp.]